MNKDELVDYCKEASQTISELDYKNRILEKENKRLSEQLELLTSKLDEYDLIVDERNQLKKQLKEYKKDIEDLDNQNQIAFENMQLNQLKVCNMIKQQKEFIKYLEDEIERKRKNATCMFEYNDTVLPLKEVLQEYKEIIGENNGN